MVDRPGQDRHGWRNSADLTRPASDKMRAVISTGYKLEGMKLSWEDADGDPIENHLDDIVTTTIVGAELHYRRRETAHHEWLVSRKAQLIEEARKRIEEDERKERERRIRAEQARLDRLLGEAAAFRQANDIRGYVQSAREANTTSCKPASDTDLETWALWALAQADRIDPVLSKRFLEDDPETPGTGREQRSAAGHQRST